MHKRIVFVLFGLAFMILGCTEQGPTPVAPTEEVGAGIAPEVEAQAWAILEQIGWPLEASEGELARAGMGQSHENPTRVFEFERAVITEDVVHYSFNVPTGPGEYDRIGVHRVVRESRPYHPIRSDEALFLLHGDLKRFETMFIPGRFSPDLADDFGIAVYLAQNGVDVWGIDQAWNFVPPEETDFSFFADWGVQREVDHLAIGLGIARMLRFLTGNGLDKMLLLGYSSGSATGYALLNQESQWPAWRRQVRGYIAADFGVRTDDPDWLTLAQGLVAQYQAAYDAGQYQDPIGFLQDGAFRARTDPDGASPYAPGLTNLQFALFVGGGPIFAPSAAHYHAPVLEGGFPAGFQFVTVDQWLDFLTASAFFEPILFELEYSRMIANLPTAYTDHLGDITVPVFDLGTAGGVGPYTAATTSYLGSTDVQVLYVSVGAPDPALEFGHVDLFTASNAPTLVWQPVLEWVQDHTGAMAASYAD